jgi:hypothetical protein
VTPVDRQIPVFVVAGPGVNSALLTESLSADPKVAVGALAAGSILYLAETMPGARFVSLVEGEGEADPPEIGGLGAERWRRVERSRLIADPRGELQRLCEFIGIARATRSRRTGSPARSSASGRARPIRSRRTTRRRAAA